MIADEDRFIDLRHEPDDFRSRADRTLPCAVSASLENRSLPPNMRPASG